MEWMLGRGMDWAEEGEIIKLELVFPPKEQTDMAGKWLNLQTQDFIFE
jgi:hypothetical protein